MILRCVIVIIVLFVIIICVVLLGSQVSTNQVGDMPLEDVETLLDWMYTRELTWIALGAACFIGFIELLPEIKYHGPSINGIGISVLVVILSFILIVGCAFSVIRYVGWLDVEIKLENRFPENMKRQLWGPIGPVHNIFLEMDENGNFLGVKDWAAPVISSIFALLCSLVVIFKTIRLSKEARYKIERFDGDY